MVPRVLRDSVMLCLTFALINKDISPMIIKEKQRILSPQCVNSRLVLYVG